MDRRLLTGQGASQDGRPYEVEGADQPREFAETDIAIVGAACRLPGAPDLAAFEVLLAEGRDAVTEIPDTRWCKPEFFHPEPGHRGKSYTFAAGVLDDVYGFDPAFFGISPREAVQIDPQQRLLLELAHEAMEDAGVPGTTLHETGTGVFIGGSSWDYTTLHAGDPSVSDAYSMTGATLCSLANRISYVFNLRGPSLTVDTACSSSLVALHMACEALRTGRVPMALVGGVNMLLAPQPFVGFSRASMLSPRGRCHAFDARADGYVRSEGGGIVLLKPLRDALRDHDRIRAVVRGTGTNSDGRTTGLSLPSKDAQAALLREVYDRFGIDPDELDYVEAHGTGTPAGDPIEAGALGEVLGRARSAPLPIGSVKTNIGHLEAGSGMAGLLKAMLVLQNRVIPASLHCATPNPNIPFADLNLALVPEARALRSNGHMPTVGINSFGFGGTNAHAVLGTAPLPAPRVAPGVAPAPRVAPAPGTLPPLLVSARSTEALRGLAAAWRSRILMPDADVPALLRAAARRREHHDTRLAVLGATPEALAKALTGFLDGADGVPAASGATVGRGVAFVFSGNGSQWAGMGRDALRTNTAFRTGMERADAALRALLGWSVIDALGGEALVLADTAVAQPLLFAIQVGATEALRAAGVHPAACMGHSVGEVAAAWAAGALSLDQAAQVIHARSRRQQETHGDGGMAVLGLPRDEAATAAERFGLEIAAENASSGVTVAGPLPGIAALEAEAVRHGWTFTRLDLAYAFHSAAMDPIRAPLLHDLAGLQPGPTTLPLVSTVTGAVLEGEALDGEYWWHNVRHPVRFAAAARHVAATGTRIFLEVGPQPVLQSYLHDALRANGTPGAALPTLSRRRQAADAFALAAARCYVAGYPLASHTAYDGPNASSLPGYPFVREQFRLALTDENTDRLHAAIDHPLLGWRSGPEPEEWVAHLDTASTPILADHQVGGAPVMPAACMVAMLLAAARARAPKAAALELTGLEIGRALPFEPGQARAVRTRVSADGHATVASRPRLAGESWAVHATAAVGAAATDAVLGEWGPMAAPVGTMPAPTLYALASGLGLEYGPAFRTVSGVSILSDTEAAVALHPVTAAAGPLDPTLLDGALQGLLALAARRLGAAGRMGMMPWRFGQVRLLGDAVPALARLHIRQTGPRAVAADILLLDAKGAAVAELLECWFVAVSLATATDPATRCLRIGTVAAADPLAPTPPATLLDVALATASIEAPEDGLMLAAIAEAYVAARAGAALRDVPEGLADGDAALHATLQGWGQADAAETDLPPAEDLLRSLLFDVPEAGADAALLAAAGDALPAVLRGDAPRPVPPAALLDQFLHNAPAGRRSLAALGDAAVAVARAWPPGQALRILEVGAGRGTGTRVLAQRLAAAHSGLRYTASTTDALLPVLADAVAGLDGVTAQGPEAAGPYDLVLSLHGLTRGSLSAAALGALRGQMVPGGVLLAVEPLPNAVWDLVGIPSVDGVAQPFDEATWTDTLAVAGFAACSAELAPSAWPATLLAACSLRRAADAAPLPGRVLLLADEGDALAEGLAVALREDGTAVASFDPLALAGAAGVVMLLPEMGAAGAAATLGRVAAMVEPLATAGIPLTLVTRGDDAFAAALGGLRRVLANEAAGVRSRLIQVAPNLPDAARRLAAEVQQPDAEDEILLSLDGRRAVRLRPGLPPPPALPGTSGVLVVERPGLLGTLRWRPAPSRGDLAADEVAITVEAAGLNFRDVMWAMGLLPDEALLRGFAGPTLGLECAGTVAAIGPGVTDLAVGDRVMAFAPASLGTEAVTKRHAVAPLPPGLSFAAGATVPVAFFTVAYALGELARLENGERVLIHGGAGGVGLAAIQYARHRGATVFATAGSDAKRALLRQLGVDHVLDSRDLAFADQVMALTGGVGVDVVLNSLSGEAMERSLGLLAPFGRFVELGKRDFYRNTPIGIRPLRHNASYFAVDADQLPLSRPRLAARILGEIGALLEQGALRPLPYRSYAFDDAVDAFRLMQSAGHIGKIVLEPGAAPPPLAMPVPAFAADPAGTYLITGGLSGFGLETARWLARHGARHLALAGRRGGDTPGAADALAALAADGVQAHAWSCDLADEAAVAAMLDGIRAAMPPLVGVAHAAMVMDDAFLPSLDAARFAAVLGPKWGGAETLDRLTRRDALSLFLLFSSVTTVLGNPGQASYVAANAALEAIAVRRHAEGLPALAVGWGPIGDAGYLARAPEVSEALARRLGTAHLKAQDALDVLPAMLASGAPVVHHADLGGARRTQLPLLASPLYEFLATGTAAADENDGGDLRAMIAGRTPDEARRTVADALAAEVAAILQLPATGVSVSRPLAEFGMDSLMAVELRTAVEARFGVNLPLFSLSEGMTLTVLAAKLVDPLLGGADAPEPAAPTAVDALLSRYETAADVDTAPPLPDSFAARAQVEA